MGLYMLECIRLSLMSHSHTFISVPFLLIFASGYLYVGVCSLWSQVQTWRILRPAAADNPRPTSRRARRTRLRSCTSGRKYIHDA